MSGPPKLALIGGGVSEGIPVVVVVSSLARPEDRREMSRLLRIALVSSSAADAATALRGARDLWRARARKW